MEWLLFLDGFGRVHDSHGGYSKEFSVFLSGFWRGFSRDGTRLYFLGGRRILGKKCLQIGGDGWDHHVSFLLGLDRFVLGPGFRRCYQTARIA